MFKVEETITINQKEPEYPMLYASLAACVTGAKAHLDNDNSEACRKSHVNTLGGIDRPWKLKL